jgi:branched-chain amino acid transport system permease protein
MAIFAMSLDLLVGYTGLVSFGHAAYFGLAGYALALMAPKYETVSLWWTLPASIGVCALFALVTGMLVLRTRGIYFIMVTLAFAQMLFFVFHDTKLGGGSDGIYIYAKPTMKTSARPSWSIWRSWKTSTGWCWSSRRAATCCCAASSAPASAARCSASRSTSTACAPWVSRCSSTSSPAFTLAGSLAGLSGYMAAVQYGFVNPEILSWHQSGAVLMMVILGGMGTLYGAVIGAFAFVILQEVLSNQAWFGIAAKHWQLAMGILIMLVALYMPQGLAGLMPKLRASRRLKPRGRRCLIPSCAPGP